MKRVLIFIEMVFIYDGSSYSAPSMADMEADAGGQPAREGDGDSDGEEDDRLFVWMANEEMDAEDDGDGDVEAVEQPVDTEASESFELEAPAERSGHIAVVYGNVMYVWGGYKVGS